MGYYSQNTVAQEGNIFTTGGLVGAVNNNIFTPTNIVAVNFCTIISVTNYVGLTNGDEDMRERNGKKMYRKYIPTVNSIEWWSSSIYTAQS